MSNQKKDKPRKVTTRTVLEMKAEGEKISMLTAYDYTMARIVDRASVDIILVGDSAANVMAGYDTTLPMTMEQMMYHASCVARGANHALVVSDMPFLSYQVSPQKALENAGRMMKETGVQGVKLEGGREVTEAISKMVQAGIPVMGHLGLTPQSINEFGSFGVRANEESEAKRLMEDAKRLQKAGCFSIVLEKIPAKLAGKVSDNLTIPTISIGAGAKCDGQVLVLQDMLGLNKDFNPKFLRRYADMHQVMSDAVSQYISDVKSGDFPGAEEEY